MNNKDQIVIIEKDIDTLKTHLADLKYRYQTLEKDAIRLETDLKSLSGVVITKEKFAPYEKLASAIGISIALTIVGAIMAGILK